MKSSRMILLQPWRHGMMMRTTQRIPAATTITRSACWTVAGGKGHHPMMIRREFSSMAMNTTETTTQWDITLNPTTTTTTALKHCNTCTCDEEEETKLAVTKDDPVSAATAIFSPDAVTTIAYPCGSPKHEDEFGRLPPPLPEPTYSVHKRVLPSSLTALSSRRGRQLLLEAFANQTAESYWSLMEQFVNQSDPAFCGVTTLLMVLNSMCIDPQVRWRGGWRFYGSEEVLLDRCCLSAERIRRIGLTLEEFRLLGKCHGLTVELKRPSQSPTQSQSHSHRHVSHNHTISKDHFTMDDFRKDIQRVLKTKDEHEHEHDHANDKDHPADKHNNNHHHDNSSILVVSFSRQHLGQTGDGHFSPLAAYHEETDQVLVLDVARFKYSPYWVPVEDLYKAMERKDSATKRSRGWFVLHPPKNHACHYGTIVQEDRRPAELVPLVGQNRDACPVSKVKVDFCKANYNHNDSPERL